MSAKTLFPNKVTVISTEGWNCNISSIFEDALNPQHRYDDHHSKNCKRKNGGIKN
jgi:hypothetical protein